MHTKRIAQISLAFVLSAALWGCSGDTSGGDANSTMPGTQFVSDSDSSGSISVTVNETSLPVGDITGFSVHVRDAQGAPVPGVAVACDSEQGIAILEPTTGREFTDGNGLISGKIGCRVPGSLEFACRLPVGMNKRQLVRMKCTGDIPKGFDGFPGAAGGGLGSGGVDSGGIGGQDISNVRITGIIARTVAGDSYQIDTLRDVCDSGPPPVFEPYTDDFVKITIVNNTTSTIVFNELSYVVPDAGAGGATFDSDPIEFTCEVPANGGTRTCESLFIQAKTGTTKTLYGASSPVSISGFSNLTFRVRGTVRATGEEVILTARSGFAFADYNNCGG